MATSLTADLAPIGSPAAVMQAVEAPVTPRRRRKRAATLAFGDRIGPWRVEREIGRGGMGSVWAVVHNGFGKKAALKLCHASVLGPQFTMETFLREARIVHLVDHPGVVDVFATGTFERRPYLAMERLAGKTLGQRIDDAPLSRVDAIDYLLEICDVLASAHRAGIVHRDLKLDNVFVLDTPGAGGRRTKLLDWGVARILGEDDPMKGMIAGTLTYVAPEQIRGDEITTAADLYSLGVMAYMMLLGAAPFSSPSDLDLIKQHLHAPPPAPEGRWLDIPPALARLLVKLLSKDPAQRPSMEEVVTVLQDTRALLVPRKSLFGRIATLPPLPPLDVLGRPAPLASGKHRVLGAAFGVVTLAASAAMWLVG